VHGDRRAAKNRPTDHPIAPGLRIPGVDRPIEARPDLSASDRQFLFRVVQRIVRDAATADDLTQDALLRAHRHRDSFRGASSRRTWLYRIAVTTALGHLRREWRRARHVAELGDERGVDALPSHEADAAAQLAVRERSSVLTDALRALPPGYRDVLILRFGDDLSERDTATALGLSVANVKVRAHRARRMLDVDALREAA
jgi:RNA polymerase sigma-70 factor (ECF subfamily)